MDGLFVGGWRGLIFQCEEVDLLDIQMADQTLVREKVALTTLFSKTLLVLCLFFHLLRLIVLIGFSV